MINNNFFLKQLPPLGLYIHIPWCIKKCPYCDFNSHNLINSLPEEKYIDSLVADLEQAVPLIWGRTVSTIFIGGGTPSLFSGDSIDQIITVVRKYLKISPYAEITIEANPETVDNEHIKDYKIAGINRISLGAQSFNDKHLQILGRIHDNEKTKEALYIIKKHFVNFNLDLMYGLPNQSIIEALEDLVMAISYNPAHISCYNLTIEPNTVFHNKVPIGLPDNDLCYQMQDAIINKLKDFNYLRYEISAFAKEGKQCQHNLNYWQFGDYLGVGAGAHSKLSFYDKIVRQVRQKQPQQYISSVLNNTHIIDDKVVLFNELPFEFALNSLRLIDGFDSQLFVERTGLPLNIILPKLNEAVNRGFIEFKGSRIKPTKLGQDFQNELLMMFLEDKLSCQNK